MELIQNANLVPPFSEARAKLEGVTGGPSRLVLQPAQKSQVHSRKANPGAGEKKRS
jgi:hypothetical protein